MVFHSVSSSESWLYKADGANVPVKLGASSGGFLMMQTNGVP